MSDESKRQIGDKLRQPKFEDYVEGPYTKIRSQECHHCNVMFYTARANIICDTCKFENTRSTDLFRFKFNVYDYPELFDIALLNKFGWYSQGGKSRSPYNPEGVSRDHKVSTSEAKKNNYDPYYITHPLNCEIMTQRKNSSKNKKSSITYQQLKELVDKYDGEKCRT